MGEDKSPPPNKMKEIVIIRYEIVLDGWTIRGGDWKSEEEAMKAVPAMEEIFNRKFLRIHRHEIPSYERS